MSEPEKKIETSPNYAKIYLLKCQNLEKTINFQKKEIQKLNTELLKANKDKQELKMFIQTNSTLKDQVQNLKLELQNTREEYIEIIKKKDNELSKLTRDLSTLESKMLIDKSAFDKNTDIYRLKMSTLTYLQMDNKAYQEEIAVLQKQQEDYKVKVEEEMKMRKRIIY
jgi:DNA repair exonuclease SbcCD ATPase subunit